MKAQISIEYMISFGIFLVLISYIYLQYTSNITPFSLDTIKEEKRAEAFLISEILINDPGEPVNWVPSNVKRIGLANESSNMTNWIKQNKINNLPCSSLNYLLAVDRPINVFVFDINTNTGERTLLKSCTSSNLRIDQINVTVRRYAVYDGGKIAELIVQV